MRSGKKFTWRTSKAYRRKMEKARTGLGNGVGFNTQSIHRLALARAGAVEKGTGGVHANRAGESALSAARAGRSCRRATDQPPRPVPERVGEPSVFQHVIYIIKENRTYDQVLGDVAKATATRTCACSASASRRTNTSSSRDFVLLDNTYCCGILSADGHQWTDSGHRDGLRGARVRRLAAQLSGGRLRRGRPRTRWPIRRPVSSGTTRSPTAKRCAISANSPPTTKHWKDSARKRQSRLFSIVTTISLSGSNAIAYSCEPDIEALRPYHR